MVSVMNELYCHKNSSPILQMFYRIVGGLKGVIKNFANFTGKHLSAGVSFIMKVQVSWIKSNFYVHILREKCRNTELFLVRISLFSD